VGAYPVVDACTVLYGTLYLIVEFTLQVWGNNTIIVLAEIAKKIKCIPKHLHFHLRRKNFCLLTSIITKQ